MEITISQKTIEKIQNLLEIQDEEQLEAKINQIIENLIELIMRFFQ